MKHLIAICDANNAIAFNHRRLSRDRILTEDLQKRTNGSALQMDSYSYKQYGQAKDIVLEEDELLTEASKKEKGPENQWFLLERKIPQEAIEQMDEILLYRFDRRYPGDAFIRIDPEQFELKEKEEFEGFSHEKITREIWKHV